MTATKLGANLCVIRWRVGRTTCDTTKCFNSMSGIYLENLS